MTYRFYSKSEEAKQHRVSIVGEHSEGVLSIAVAICSNNDIFRRKVGRAIAEGRLKHGKLYKQVREEHMSTELFIQNALEIIQELESYKIPIKLDLKTTCHEEDQKG
jgi:hypothetical protein